MAVPNVPAYSFAKNDGFSLNAVDIALTSRKMKARGQPDIMSK